MTKPALHIAIPAMDEADYLPSTMADLFAQQIDRPVYIHVCVNQPEDYWQTHPDICENNRQTLQWLHKLKASGPPLHIIDRSSRGCDWKGKQRGVGMARKTLFQSILEKASDQDLIVSLDADTHVGPDYLQHLVESFQAHPEALAMAVPYYHPLSGDRLENWPFGPPTLRPGYSQSDKDQEIADRAILRYEIYMRCYHLNMLRIASPYAFTALGSAIAFRCRSYRRIGGMIPAQSGEDFYLMQKFCKRGPIVQYGDCCVYPSARFSTRVGFGTGPALIKGSQGDWSSYPIYPPALFDQVRQAYDALPRLYRHDLDLPFLDFLASQFKDSYLWQPLRENFKDLPHFVRAFHEKADALRILQFFKQSLRASASSDTSTEAASLSAAQALDENLQLFTRCYADLLPEQMHPTLLSGFAPARIEEAPTSLLAQIRDQLFQMEMMARKNACL